MKTSKLYKLLLPFIISPAQISTNLPKSAMMAPCTHTSLHHMHKSTTSTSVATIMDTSPH